jgi:hypothetical protein
MFNICMLLFQDFVARQQNKVYFVQKEGINLDKTPHVIYVGSVEYLSLILLNINHFQLNIINVFFP